MSYRITRSSRATGGEAARVRVLAFLVLVLIAPRRRSKLLTRCSCIAAYRVRGAHGPRPDTARRRAREAFRLDATSLITVSTKLSVTCRETKRALLLHCSVLRATTLLNIAVERNPIKHGACHGTGLLANSLSLLFLLFFAASLASLFSPAIISLITQALLDLLDWQCARKGSRDECAAVFRHHSAHRR